jgi:outer membrane receptor protein involved in Fe transport
VTVLRFVLLLALSPVAAAAALHGRVTDATGAPVPHATIQSTAAAGPGCSATTSDDGDFVLACAESGAHLRVTAPGFEPADIVAGTSPVIVRLAPATYTEGIVVTASRAEGLATSPAAPVSVLTSSDLALVPPAPLDDALRVVPGFSLFRRTTSRAANPTTQGAGLRGLAASGASRALVLADGVPLNDPFGGWVYWSRVPETLVDRVEIVRGAASDLYGADALAGVVQILTRPPSAQMIAGDLEGATHTTGRASLAVGGARNGWDARAGGELFSTDGYVLVPEDERGAVDTPATQRYASARMAAGYEGPRFHARLTGDVYGEHRDNGTPIQTNSTDIRQASVDLGGTALGGAWSLDGQAGDQSYDQTFSAIAADRDSETLTSRQYVPATQHGFAVRWERSWSAMDVLAGADTRDVSATNHEWSYAPSGAVRAATDTPGFQRTSGAYAQLTLHPSPSVTATTGLRGDVRQRSHDEGWLDGDSAVSPRLSVAWAASPLVTVRGSLGWAFRAPTLNERYRGFRVGNIVTLPNPNLTPETLRAVEGSVLFSPRRGSLRVTMFRNDLADAVTNVTLTSTNLLITRRRENVGGVVAWGSEIEGEYRLTSGLTATGAAALTSSTYDDYAPLDGFRVPQVPHWQGSIGLRGAGPAGFILAGSLRAFGAQFEDDRNTLVLRAGSVADVTALHAVTRRLTAYVSLENLFDVAYDVGRTPVRTIGQPFTLHAGLRFRAGR